MSAIEQLGSTQREKLYVWPHGISHVLACFSCTVGLYTINRFGYLVYQYKGPFLVQFFILSVVLGLPFYFLAMSLGNSMAKVRADLWSISPAFKGIGVAMLYLKVIIGTYSSLPLSWFLRYFQDSFVTADETYKWSKCNSSPLNDICYHNRSYIDVIGNSVPSYLHLGILQRKPNSPADNLRFESSFGLGVIWVIVFVCLCYNLRFYGKVVLILSLVPLVLLCAILIRFVDEWSSGVRFIFDAPWGEDMRNSWMWFLAGREVVLIWILFSDVTLQICSCSKQGIPIIRSFFIVVILTFFALIASSFLFCCGVEAIRSHHAVYLHSSYEDVSTVRVLEHLNCSRSERVRVANMWIGENLITPPGSHLPSGYQPVRFSAELMPAVFALEGPNRLTPFWAIGFYAMVLLFGIGQQVSIWWCLLNYVITMNSSLLRPWETLISLGLCVIGYVLSLPMTKCVGISIIYYLDCCVGSLWWVLFLFLVMLVAIIFIDGKPYGLEHIIPEISQSIVMQKLIIPVLVVTWHIILPIAYLVISIVFLRASQYEMNFPWTNHRTSWTQWTRYLGVMIQIFPLIIVGSICLTQLFIYLCNQQERASAEGAESCYCCCVNSDLNSLRRSTIISMPPGQVDEPPKYTPPPSYSTATSRAVRNVLRRVSTSIELATINVTPRSLPDLISYTESRS